MSGTKCTDPNGFSAGDICDIIKACAKSKVVEIELGGARIKFANTPPGLSFESPWRDIAVDKNPLDVSHSRDIAQNAEELSSKQWDKMSTADKEAFEETQMCDMILNDPVGYEALAVDKCLEAEEATNEGVH